ncbi:hypothetical protein KJE20_13874 [Pyrenophora tritici-repentis]|nr:hypothetical protein KJE20_13874 [Pyrenophora tritici-repentis]
MRDCSKLGKARQLLKEYEVEKKQRKKKSLPPKSSKPPPKLEKPKKKTSKAYGAEEARSDSELETSTDTLDSEDEEIETCRLSKDILAHAQPAPAEPTPAEPTPAQPTEQAATEQVEPPTAEEMEPPPAEQMDTSPAEQVELNPEPIERRRGRPRKLTTAPPTTVSRDERVPDLHTCQRASRLAQLARLGRFDQAE